MPNTSQRANTILVMVGIKAGIGIRTFLEVQEALVARRFDHAFALIESVQAICDESARMLRDAERLSA